MLICVYVDSLYIKKIIIGNRANTKNSFDKFIEKTKYVLERTAIEIALFAVLGGGIFGFFKINNEFKRAKTIPLSFAEIEQTEKDIAKLGKEIWPIASYSMRVNDMCMKIFEAYNESHYLMGGGSTEEFASNIYNAWDYRNIYKYNLQDLLDTLSNCASGAKNKLEDYQIVADKLSIINKTMDDAWIDYHNDHYSLVVKTRIVTDSDGNTSIETYTELEYDRTTHIYI